MKEFFRLWELDAALRWGGLLPLPPVTGQEPDQPPVVKELLPPRRQRGVFASLTPATPF